MLAVPEKLTGITHPQVASIYLKKDLNKGFGSQDILVIETNYDDHEDEYESFDSYLMNLLTDLDDLQRQAEEKIGTFDQVEIRH